jgi:two-component system, LytTR family, response regulator
MISCMIVDDEPYAVSLLEEYINRLSYLQLETKCYNALEALEYLKQDAIDLIFLDINMPQLNGMQLATLFPAGQKFIFVTAYSGFAVESYERNAIDYLLKPVTFERFLKAVQKAEGHLKEQKSRQENMEDGEQSYFIKSGKTFISIKLKDILFIEGLKDYVLFHTQSGKYIVYKRMKELEETLPTNFLRIHNSYIVNTNCIEKIEDNHVFVNKEKIAMSDKYKDNFLKIVHNKLL